MGWKGNNVGDNNGPDVVTVFRSLGNSDARDRVFDYLCSISEKELVIVSVKRIFSAAGDSDGAVSGALPVHLPFETPDHHHARYGKSMTHESLTKVCNVIDASGYRSWHVRKKFIIFICPVGSLLVVLQTT
jgi:hypothetical protein